MDEVHQTEPDLRVCLRFCAPKFRNPRFFCEYISALNCYTYIQDQILYEMTMVLTSGWESIQDLERHCSVL